MKKYLIKGVLILIAIWLLLSIVIIPTHGSSEAPVIAIEENEAQRPILYPEFQYITTFTSNNCLNQIKKANSYMKYLRSQETTFAVQIEIDRTELILKRYAEDHKRLLAEEAEKSKWDKRAEEYPEATEIWQIMKEEFGWSNYVCAGIIGNMMSECGGQTLKGLSNWNIDGNSGYGLIQWIGGRRKAIENKYGDHPTIREQLYFVKDELFGSNGVTKQVSDNQLEKILNSTTPEEAAANFARYFERPASTNYSRRQSNARIAYEYFVG